MDKLKEIQSEIETAIQKLNLSGEPADLYDPLTYILGLGGKRIRPAMVLAAYSLFDQKRDHRCLSLATAVELFHNFTLLHDDIMDNSSLRRGHETVHVKWNQPTAILSGDLMLIKVYELLAELNDKHLMLKFNQMAVALCEGQMMDMNFEKLDLIDNQQYLVMIQKKTAVLLAFALEGGAYLSSASSEEQTKLHQFGIHLGLAFQLIDDYLDTFGAQAEVGKRIGGDILEQKKTYLWNAMMSKLSEEERILIATKRQSLSEDEYINMVKEYMIQTGAANKTKEHAMEHHQLAIKQLDSIKATGDSEYLKAILNVLEKRSF